MSVFAKYTTIAKIAGIQETTLQEAGEVDQLAQQYKGQIKCMTSEEDVGGSLPNILASERCGYGSKVANPRREAARGIATPDFKNLDKGTTDRC